MFMTRGMRKRQILWYDDVMSITISSDQLSNYSLHRYRASFMCFYACVMVAENKSLILAITFNVHFNCVVCIYMSEKAIETV